jgi:peptidoglycan hydrolase-like protein with peptidoglycan-binding domain
MTFSESSKELIAMIRRGVMTVVLGAVLAVVLGAVALTGPASAAPRAQNAALLAASCDSNWWTAVNPTRTTLVPTKNGTGDANCVLGSGNQGPGVRALQNVLRKCYGQSIARDGIFGADTELAVKNAQTWENAVSNAGLAVDGVYGNKTRIAITWPLYTSKNIDTAYVCRSVSWG